MPPLSSALSASGISPLKLGPGSTGGRLYLGRSGSFAAADTGAAVTTPAASSAGAAIIAARRRGARGVMRKPHGSVAITDRDGGAVGEPYRPYMAFAALDENNS